MDLEGPKCPYAVGNNISLQLGEHVVDAKITRVFDPFTMAYVMVLLMDSPALGLMGHVVLKLYDRRFASNARVWEKAGPWTLDIEEQYHQFIQEGESTEEKLDIPRLLAPVTLPASHSLKGATVNEFVDIPGIILQYIDGFHLIHLADNAPRETWQSVIENAIGIVHQFYARGILNEDVKIRNIIVRMDEDGEYKVFMVDLALCKFRRQYRDEEHWRELKAHEDEEGTRYHQFPLDGGESDSSGEDGDDEDGEGDDEDGVDYSDEEEDEEENGEEEEQKGWTAPRTEADLHNLTQRLYRTEVEAYQALKDRQGEDIPRFLACIAIPGSSPVQEESLTEHIHMSGILLQNINGFHLADLAQHAPRETWQSICEDAIRITSLLYNRGILNKDVKTRNLIVRKELEGNFKVFMIDFALCRFRREYKSDSVWRECKAHEDEEGAVGFVMQRYLQGGFIYHRSALYEKLDEDYMMGD